MNWSHKLILSFLLFISFIGFMTFKMICTNVDLVNEGYYEDEIAYQQTIERLKNGSIYEAQLVLKEKNGSFLLQFPKSLASGTSGNIRFFRPSDKRLDFNIPIQIDDLGEMKLPTQKILPGFWRLKISFLSGGKSFQIDKELTL